MLENGGWAKGSRKSGFLKVPYLTVLECSSSSSTTRGLGREVLVLARDKRVGKVVFLFSYLTPESLTKKKELE